MIVCPHCSFDKARPRVWPLICRCGAVIQHDGTYTPPRPLGLGDLVAWGVRWIGIRKKCGGCRKRQAMLNRWWPF